MKFARYLQDTQTPEWKKAYIDYRGLKVQLGTIRAQVDTSSSLATVDVDRTRHFVLNDYDDSEKTQSERGKTTSVHIARASGGGDGLSLHGLSSPMRRLPSNQERPSPSLVSTANPLRVTGTASKPPSQQTPRLSRIPRSPSPFPFIWDSGSSTPLHTILPQVPTAHDKFFDMLGIELDKVVTFYAEREKEMCDRTERLREQLNELGIHNQVFHRSVTHSMSWVKKAVPSLLLPPFRLFSVSRTKSESPVIVGNDTLTSESGRNGRGVVETSNLRTQTGRRRWSGDHSRPKRLEEIKAEVEKKSDNSSERNSASSSNAPDALDDSHGSPSRRSSSLPRPTFSGPKRNLDPHEYQHAKRRLRRAVTEHYRGLEVLNNYRVLNLAGFRKALKKYEKITKNSILDAYMKEKVEPSAFASGATVSTMLKEMEDLFATRFEHGDRKKALDHLRAGLFTKTHHFSTFRAGLWLGLSLPAIAAGAGLSLQDHTRELLPSWNILLFIYSVFFIPVLLALLIGINIAIWARKRINYVFIFELNPRTRLDNHEYFELPSFMLCTLAYSFWFSFARIGPPTLWPLVWLSFIIVVMFNPVHSFMWGSARWWTIKNAAKLGTSGLWKVEFTDFWLGDQFCSLVYSISNLYFVGCFYTHFLDIPTPHPSGSTGTSSTLQGLLSSAYDPRVQDAWSTCGASRNWGWYYFLSTLPFMVRFVQSIRRYGDSKLPTHLINAGKYGMGIVYYFFYYHWRHQGMTTNGAGYILLSFTGIAYSIYACVWDFLMDWSVCKPHARYPLLRPELVYKSHIPAYYFALVSNLCIRFIWLTYHPAIGFDLRWRMFIAAVLEMLRRVQWNFYRLENEHLGNMDQYRVTHEVPLPYNFDAHFNEDEEDHEEVLSAPSQRRNVGRVQ